MRGLCFVRLPSLEEFFKQCWNKACCVCLLSPAAGKEEKAGDDDEVADDEGEDEESESEGEWLQC